MSSSDNKEENYVKPDNIDIAETDKMQNISEKNVNNSSDAEKPKLSPMQSMDSSNVNNANMSNYVQVGGIFIELSQIYYYYNQILLYV